MPKDPSIRSVLVIGSGPIVIGQACEFDYSGTQAVKVLRQQGIRVSLVNSNPATIMTDPEYADRTYVEPLTPDFLEKILLRERPDAVLPTVGGQTALNLAVDLSRRGVLDRLGIRLIGASRKAVEVGEDRRLFKEAMSRIGLDLPRSGFARNLEEAVRVLDLTGLPAVIRPSFTLGGSGGGIAYNKDEFEEIVARGLDLSPVHEILVEESVLGWKEYELEVMRDHADNFVVICSIENFDPMGIHTGDSVTVAPAQTLTDREYQAMRNAARRVIREVGVETGGSNIQFAVDPKNGRMVVIEMNPRVSRSSALASKATGFPIAKIAAKLALGYHLDEIPNDITRLTPASFEPTIDYVVVKIPRWNFEKFPQADRTLTTQMKSVGEVMAIGRTFKEAFMKGMRSLELGRSGLLFAAVEMDRGEGGAQGIEAEDDAALRKRLAIPSDRRIWHLFRAIERGWSVDQLHEITNIDPWFLQQFAEIGAMRREAAESGIATISTDQMRRLKRAGFGDQDQLQSGDGVDRLRHRRSPLLSAAHVRRRHGGDRDGAVGRRRRLVPRAIRRTDAAQARARAAGGGREDSRHVARFDRPCQGPEALREAARRSRHHAAGQRHGDVAPGSAGRRRHDRIPRRRAPVVRARRTRDGDRVRRHRARSLHDARRRRVAGASDPRRQVPRGRVRVRRRRHRRRDRRRRPRRHHGAHRGSRHPFR